MKTRIDNFIITLIILSVLILNSFPYAVAAEGSGQSDFTIADIAARSYCLPPGLKLSRAGLISGSISSKAKPGIYTFRVKVKDSAGGSSAGDLSVPIK